MANIHLLTIQKNCTNFAMSIQTIGFNYEGKGIKGGKRNTSSLVVVVFPCLVALAEKKVEINSGQLSPLLRSAHG
jgi:hypothetical protein